LLIIYVVLLAAIGVYWAFAPARMLIAPTVAAFFLAGFSKFGILVVTNHYFLNIAAGADRVGSAMIMRIVAGSVAGFIGAVAGGSILGVLHSLGVEGMEVYRTYFRLAALGLIAMVPVALRLDRLNEWPLHRAALLLLRPREILRLRREQ
jgi:hypothetical protein